MKHLLTQPLTKIIPYTLKRIAFTTSRASEMKERTKEAHPINLYSEKYIRILQMLETQLKRNSKGNPPFYHSPLHLSFMTLPCSHNRHHLPVLLQKFLGLANYYRWFIKDFTKIAVPLHVLVRKEQK